MPTINQDYDKRARATINAAANAYVTGDEGACKDRLDDLVVMMQDSPASREAIAQILMLAALGR